MRATYEQSLESIQKSLQSMPLDDFYEWYKYIGCANSKFPRKEKTEVYLNDKSHSFISALKSLQSLVSVPVFQYRKARDYRFMPSDDYADKIIAKETYIQRNLYKNCSLYYQSVLGTIIGLEVVPVGDQRRNSPIDLVSYKKESGKLKIYLTELKRCQLLNLCTETKDLLLKAVFEITTYYAYFKKALDNDQGELAHALSDRINRADISANDIKNSDVELIVLGPDSLINELYEPYFHRVLELCQGKLKYHFVSIKTSDCFSANSKVNSAEKLFDISEAKMTKDIML